MEKIYAYETYEDGKGIIIASSYKKARKIFEKEFSIPVVEDDDEEGYWNGGAYIYEVGSVENNKVYEVFEG